MRGIVFDIKHFSTHDGPGIRTTVFLKGCSLSCKWCQNPEGISAKKEIWYFQNKCISCYECVNVCPTQAISKKDGTNNGIVLDYNKCNLNGNCVDVCPKEALAFVGKEMTPEEVFQEVLKDKTFYEVSNGGVTISGGDPLVNKHFCYEILKLCKSKGIHTTIETCLDAKKEDIIKISEVTDLIIADMKIFDNAMHEEFCGKSNARIKENIEYLAKSNLNILIRIPLIPKISATETNLTETARFLSKINPNVPVELINFNPLATSKYKRMGKSYNFEHINPYSISELKDMYNILETNGLKNTIKEF